MSGKSNELLRWRREDQKGNSIPRLEVFYLIKSSPANRTVRNEPQIDLYCIILHVKAFFFFPNESGSGVSVKQSIPRRSMVWAKAGEHSHSGLSTGGKKYDLVSLARSLNLSGTCPFCFALLF